MQITIDAGDKVPMAIYMSEYGLPDFVCIITMTQYLGVKQYYLEDYSEDDDVGLAMIMNLTDDVRRKHEHIKEMYAEGKQCDELHDEFMCECCLIAAGMEVLFGQRPKLAELQLNSS
jgi:hypothetical protein